MRKSFISYIATIFLFEYYIFDSLILCRKTSVYYAKGKKQWQISNLQKKRVLVAKRNTERNVAFKSSIKTAVKKALSLVKGDEKELSAAISKVYQLCDKAVSKGILHKNTAARKKSRLTKAINKLTQN